MGTESHPEKAQELFDEFVSASTCRAALRSFSQLCEHLDLVPDPDRGGGGGEQLLYRSIERRLSYWKANALWAKLDRRASQQEYLQNRACRNTTCAVIGAGPCGLRAAVELSFLGARVVVLEKRDSFSRNNVLHLWPFTIHDLRGLGAKKFYGKFCAGSIDHISIRQLQLVLLKVALLLGVEVHVNVEFKRAVEPPRDQRRRKVGWTIETWPTSHVVNRLQVDVIVGADGHRNTLPGFRRKEFRGRLAIAITANFKNRNTRAEAKVEEIGGVASIFNQKFFRDLRQETGIDLENMVYYKDDTHYFVMTAKKRSLLDKRVILQDFAETELLLSRTNVDQNALRAFARTAADFSTNGQLPSLDFATNHHGQPDVAVFDFTSTYASENAAVVRRRRGHRLLVTLVGDSLLEPFWPMGTGVARGFLAALDASWMIRGWCQGASPLDLLAERESVYRLLAQTTPENMQKNFSSYSLDPSSRYVNICLSVTPEQVRHLVDTGEKAGEDAETVDAVEASPWRPGEMTPFPFAPVRHVARSESLSESNRLLRWCREQTEGYSGVAVSDLTTSWKSGVALCALVHRYRPELIDFDSLNPAAEEENIRLAFDVCEREFGISPLVTAEEMKSAAEPDPLSMVVYLSRFYRLLRDAPPSSADLDLTWHVSKGQRYPDVVSLSLDERPPATPSSVAVFGLQEPRGGPAERQSPGSRVRSTADLLQAKLGRDSSSSAAAAAGSELTPEVDSRLVADREETTTCVSDVCFFCHEKVYVMERLSAEGLFFHRRCFVCHLCRGTLRISAYRFHAASGTFSCAQRCESSARRSPSTLGNNRVPSRRRRTSCTSLLSAESCVSMATESRRLSVFSVMSVTRERIELENDKAEAGEISEEILTGFNLSAEKDVRTSSSECEAEAPTFACQSSEAAWEEALMGCEDGEEENDEEEDEAGSEEDSGDDTSDVTPSETPPLDKTPPLPDTPSTASYIAKVDSASSICTISPFEKGVPPTEALVVTETSTAGGAWPSLDNISLKKVLPPQEECVKGAGPDDVRRRGPHLKAPPFCQSEVGGARALWKAVFSRNRNKRKERACDAPVPEDDDASWSAVQRRCSPVPKNDLCLETIEMTAQFERLAVNERDGAAQPAYVPHALAFKRASPIKFLREPFPRRGPLQDSDGRSSRATEVVGVLVQPEEPSGLSVPESLFRTENRFQTGRRDEHLDRRKRRQLQKSARRRAKRRDLKRLHKAQLIQRQLHLVEEEQRRLEARGVALERSVRGEEGASAQEKTSLMQLWFQLVQQKNVLVRYESELAVFARELQLEDRQSGLQRELRERMTLDDRLKDDEDFAMECAILEEMLEVVERRKALVPLLEELRLQNHQEDHKLKAAMFGQDWT
ncbi:protein-methionine sulfoxide oxidase mical3a-like isoform X3 [Phyllopteryx taeniolatus]|uniref:protein-methionine sulfoxide oxidase mical3a-like isoform X3 n=1 Tax=Phyllopteryx taeniolatus TaxID=161469 RepID=UPI002AD25355|nr:protein-methionine sulfoxide oxidase mical3a-like isoform X3 [Phyllopteryx taeniolatus]